MLGIDGGQASGGTPPLTDPLFLSAWVLTFRTTFSSVNVVLGMRREVLEVTASRTGVARVMIIVFEKNIDLWLRCWLPGELSSGNLYCMFHGDELAT